MTLNEAYLFLARRQIHFEIDPDSYKEVIESGKIALNCIEKRIPMLVDTRKTQWGERDFCPICGCVIENCHSRFCISRLIKEACENKLIKKLEETAPRHTKYIPGWA